MGKENVKTLILTPTVDTSGAYASGDRCGSLMTLTDIATTSGDGVLLESVVIFSKVVITTPAFYVLFFNAVPTIASADNAPIDISDAEMAAKCIGMVPVTTSKALANNCLLENTGVTRALDPAAGQTTVYAQLVVEAAPTFTTTTDLTVIFKVREW